jgi:hypothetical protein
VNNSEFLELPIGIDSPRWVTRSGCRTVLVVVHTMVSCHRLLDVVDYVESDPRVQVVFTVAPDMFNHDMAHHLRGLGALVLPWEQAVRERFDLALAAAYGGLAQVHAPLVVMAHGAGHGKLTGTAVYGLDVQRLTRDGQPLPAALLLSHRSELGVLRRQCPQALPVAVVAGDPCFDRLVASLPERDPYRDALGVAPNQQLVMVSSTWGRSGLFGRAPWLLPWLMDQLPTNGYRVGALLHPAVWSAHGSRQVRAWLADCRRAGLILPEPDADWRALLVASDRVVGDHGSVTAYAAAIGRPVLRLPGPTATLNPRSAQHLVLARAGELDPDRPLPPQLAAMPHAEPDPVIAALTSRPHRAEMVIRRTLYRLLQLSEPGRHRRATPVPVP